MSDPKSPRLLDRLMAQPYLLLVLCNLFWAGNAIVSKLAPGNIDPYALTLLRWVGALLLLTPFAIRPLRREWPAIRARWWPKACGAGRSAAPRADPMVSAMTRCSI